MNEKVKELAKKFLPYKAKKIVMGIRNSYYKRKSYSQHGEDLVLKSCFPDFKTKKGFYVDIGAFHPSAISNTKLFYKNNWCGINVDAMPGSMKKFNKKRKRDINIEAAISHESKELNYFIFQEGTLNTLSESLATQWINNKRKSIKTIRIKTVPLYVILDKYITDNQVIDFMSIDCEGVDISVLKSNK